MSTPMPHAKNCARRFLMQQWEVSFTTFPVFKNLACLDVQEAGSKDIGKCYRIKNYGRFRRI